MAGGGGKDSPAGGGGRLGGGERGQPRRGRRRASRGGEGSPLTAAARTVAVGAAAAGRRQGRLPRRGRAHLASAGGLNPTPCRNMAGDTCHEASSDTLCSRWAREGFAKESRFCVPPRGGTGMYCASKISAPWMVVVVVVVEPHSCAKLCAASTAQRPLLLMRRSLHGHGEIQ